MCCASLHLLIGALLVLAVENEAKTNNFSTETTTVVTMPINITNQTLVDYIENITLTSLPPDYTVTVSNATDVNATSDGEPDSPTPPPPPPPTTTSDHAQTTTDNTEKNVPQSSTNNKIPTTTSKPATKAPQQVKDNGIIYIIIVVIAALCFIGIVVYFCRQKNSRRYSVDLHPKQEDAHIPLSTVDAEVFDTTSEKDFQTFTAVQSGVPLKDPDPVREAEKPEGEKGTADVKPENQQNLTSAQATKIPQDKTEQLSTVDLTDGEPAISTKTSMESLDDILNENNSNNTSAEASGNGNAFTEVSLDGIL